MSGPHASSSRRIRFGLYEVDLVARELRRDGVPVKLQERPFEVLAILVEQRGEVVTRDEFRQRLWSADTFVDFDASLNTSIAKLRQALSDNAENPRFIATAGRRGYRFIAPASEVPTDLPADKEASSPVKYTKRSWLVFAALGGVALAILAIGVIAVLRPAPLPKVLNLVQISHDGLLDPWGKLTTDGARIFYLDRSGGHWNLMQVPASGGEAQPFPEPSQNTRVVDISPDRAELLSFTFFGRAKDLPLSLTPVVGGPSRRVGNIVADDAVFSLDGARIIFNRPDGIYSCARDGSQVKKLVALRGRSGDLQWSKTGQRLRFTVEDPETNAASIWEVSADGSNLHAVNLNLPYPDGACCGRWSADGKYFFFNSTHDGIHSIWAMRERVRESMGLPTKPVQLTFGPINYGGLITSEDPSRVYVWGGSEQSEPARYYPASGRIQPLLPGNHSPNVRLSPDGTWLAFAIGGELWRSEADGTMRQSLVSGKSSIDQIEWSPDSKRILFHSEGDAKSERFFIVSADGGPATDFSLGSGHNEPKWRPDGESIVFAKWSTEDPASMAQSGIFFLDLKSSHMTKIPGSEGMVHPDSSPDGQFLSAITNFDLNPSQPTRVMLFDTRTRTWSEIARGTLVNPVQWSKDSRYFYYQDILADGQPTFRYSIAASRSDRFGDFESLLHAGYVRCSLIDIEKDGAQVVSLKSNEVNIYRLDLDLP
jgi:DNA-binding winged helix-turn-helix (wHTH) protein/Tol biopolymer transport system component